MMEEIDFELSTSSLLLEDVVWVYFGISLFYEIDM